MSSSDSSSQGSSSEGEDSYESSGYGSYGGKVKRTRKRTTPYGRTIAEVSSDTDSDSGTSTCEEQFGNLEIVIKPEEEKAFVLMSKVRDYVSRAMSVTDYKDYDCYNDAKRLGNVTIVMAKSLQLGNFLAMFGHSVSCRNDNCTTSCRMLRRVRGHVLRVNHSCALMHVYGQLLRMHVDTCPQDDGRCGMTSCKGEAPTTLGEIIMWFF